MSYNWEYKAAKVGALEEEVERNEKIEWEIKNVYSEWAVWGKSQSLED